MSSVLCMHGNHLPRVASSVVCMHVTVDCGWMGSSGRKPTTLGGLLGICEQVNAVLCTDVT
jgi:hypothetical protein